MQAVASTPASERRPAAAGTQAAHPLDPLAPAELLAAAQACRAKAAELGLPPLRFNSIAAQVRAAGGG